MSTLVLIPARGGSKGIPGKNLKCLGPKPLLQWTIEVAKSSYPLQDICLSSDSDEILAVGARLGLAPHFLRPAELATDEAGVDGVIRHALEYFERQGRVFRTLLLLQPTSPFRTAEHLRAAENLLVDGVEAVVGVRASDANPYFDLLEADSNGTLAKSKSGSFIRRQDCPKVWQLTGAVYLFRVASFLRAGSLARVPAVPLEMEALSSVDLDTPLDWLFAEFLLERGLISR